MKKFAIFCATFMAFASVSHASDYVCSDNGDNSDGDYYYGDDPPEGSFFDPDKMAWSLVQIKADEKWQKEQQEYFAISKYVDSLIDRLKNSDESPDAHAQEIFKIFKTSKAAYIKNRGETIDVWHSRNLKFMTRHEEVVERFFAMKTVGKESHMPTRAEAIKAAKTIKDAFGYE